MKTKKNPVHNLEKRYSLRLFVGLAVALSITLVAFEWRTPFITEVVTPGKSDTVWVEYPPVTQMEEKKEPEKPKEPEKKIFNPIDFKITDKTDESAKKQEENLTATDTTGTSVMVVKKIIDLPKEKEDDELPRVFVEIMPKFKCSDDETLLPEFLVSNTKYPVRAREMGITGTAYIEFVVDKRGKVINAKVKRGFFKDCDEEALRVVNSLPDFCPGMQMDKAVPVIYTVPIRFALQ